MELEVMGQKVYEALALQGKIDSAIDKRDELSNQISLNNQELAKLESLKKNNEVAKDTLEKANKDIKAMQDDLDDRIKALDKDGVKLPIGKDKIATKSVRM